MVEKGAREEAAIKVLEEFKQTEPIMKGNVKGELVSLSEQDKQQLAALGFV